MYDCRVGIGSQGGDAAVKVYSCFTTNVFAVGSKFQKHLFTELFSNKGFL